ncbi:probable RNA-binding protein EIF1AD [Anabas testudineus]|uniref:Probable RNA-binding protein EIF1AD n=1 Tax=Anabas testudineus TaxID=64144 RepID=A0A7N6AE03_ANATE|nr:probable RNA-binding protein EIF1AD [Anabas testudineus]XP_026212859.1 probable RNA-binding protein EIF1AD [Anabas testudineus]XP_026212860.1 probable RNA-binding protein EIF1AD [Anabas testudineus]
MMSQATKRKHVVKEVLGDFVTPTENQQIVKVISSRGNNLHEAVTAQGETFLVSMPTKFRKNIWIKRGDFVIVDPIEEGEKVKAEISFILYKHHIQYLQKEKLWPEGFIEDKTNKQQETEERDEQEEVSDSEDDESDLFVNTNRCNYQYSESEEEEDEDDSEEEDEDKEGRTENGS